jgi:choline dehydrogenase
MSAEKSVDKRFDVVVVGGGSAGAVLARRLTDNPDREVLLLEAGQVYAPNGYPEVLRNPARIGGDESSDWGYSAKLGPRSGETPAPRGKVLGGSSAVNAAVAIRARANDFQKWAARGLAGWGYPEVLDCYKAMENAPFGDSEFHGRSGPFPIRQRDYSELTTSTQAFIDSAVKQGFPLVTDVNGAEQHGVSAYPLNVVGEERQNTGIAYLTEQVRGRPNLTILGSIEIDRVLLDGTKATGVVAVDGHLYEADEVIVSAGTYGSAAILMRSGVGPAGHLRELGIEVVADLPVGQRLQDHPFYYNAFALKPGFLDMSPAAGALLWTPSSEAIGDELDLQISVTHLIDPSSSPTGGAIVLAVALVAPDSIGTVNLRSRDPQDPPVIDYNFLAVPRDRRRMLEAVRVSRAFAQDKIFASVIDAEILPGAGVQDDESLLNAIDRQLASYQHPTSTVPMGDGGDPWAVVDSTGSVGGLQALRVVDASILPQVPSTPTNVTTIMVAEHIYKNAYAG